jgi:hypothetical protein
MEHVAHMVEARNADKTVLGKREGKKPLKRPRHRWEGNIDIDLTEITFGSVD